MAITPVQSSLLTKKNGTTLNTSGPVSTTNQSGTAPRSDRVELSGRNPAAPTGSMGTYSKMRSQPVQIDRQTVVNGVIAVNKAFQVPVIQPTTLSNATKTKTMDEMAAQVNAARAVSSNVIQGPQAYATVNKVPVPGADVTRGNEQRTGSVMSVVNP